MKYIAYMFALIALIWLSEEVKVPFANASSGNTAAFVEANQTNKQPNIVLIIADDLNDFIGPLNAEIGVHTPHLDELAKKSAIFTNAHSNAPVCSPSRASMLSGIYPHKSGQYGFTHWRKNKILLETDTMMQTLSKLGYYSAGTGKVMHHQWPKAWDEYGIRPDYTPLAFDGVKTTQHPNVPAPYNQQVGPLDSTFTRLSDVPIVAESEGKPGFNGWYYGGFKKPFKYTSEQQRDLLPDEMYANWTANKIKQFDKENLDKPFFITTGLIRPHTPLVVPDRFFDMYPIDKINLPTFLKDDDADTYFESIYQGKPSKGRKHYDLLMASYENKEVALKTYYQAYLASVSFMDEQVGIMLQAIEQSRFANNTIVIFTSDHGYNLGEKDNLFKNNLWERSTKVPLIIYDARQPNAVDIDQAVSLIDVYPTIVNYATNDKPEKAVKHQLDGLNLQPLINKSESRKRYALTVVAANGKPSFALKTKQWRYIQYSNGKEELYNHAQDATEFHNLAEDKAYAEQKKLLAKQLSLLTKGAL
ncbi:sulfatase [Thalassotalea agarivorans]|uniref:Sulfatase n=1 Tax=Thalassotalea agarivorans TaxID=349064 RepID=A0A1I0GY23_THASX|nr:sulfatase [Thalassotalea agarivorans]SET75390.1 Sulfatase [Thalassotalea agarivorans]